MSIAVHVVDLTVSFHQQEVLSHITMDIPSHGIFVITGRSGSGKTTLLRSINRLNEEFDGCVTKGYIEADLGYGLKSVFPSIQKNFTLSKLRQKIGMVFQTPNVFPTSVYRNISIPLEQLTHYAKKDIPTYVYSALDRVGLLQEVENRLDIPAHYLSGGQQQRLCFARMLALEPAILLLDEPTSSLDIHATQKIESLLLGLASEYPIIMVSHNITQICRLAHEIVILEYGTIINKLTEKAYYKEILTSIIEHNINIIN